MKFDSPRKARLYCRRCDMVELFVYHGKSREYEAVCGQRIHPLTLWALYSVDNFFDPPEVMLPQHCLVDE